MGLYRRKDSPYWWMSVQINGAQFSKSTGKTDRAAAEKVLAANRSLTDTNHFKGKKGRYQPGRIAGDRSGVYFIRLSGTDFVKIGYAVDVQGRMMALQTAHPQQLELIGFIQCLDFRKEEKIAHQNFKAKRVRGEWFSLTEAEVKEYVGSR